MDEKTGGFGENSPIRKRAEVERGEEAGAVQEGDEERSRRLGQGEDGHVGPNPPAGQAEPGGGQEQAEKAAGGVRGEEESLHLLFTCAVVVAVVIVMLCVSESRVHSHSRRRHDQRTSMRTFTLQLTNAAALHLWTDESTSSVHTCGWKRISKTHRQTNESRRRPTQTDSK